jgi:hypothetical protein
VLSAAGKIPAARSFSFVFMVMPFRVWVFGFRSGFAIAGFRFLRADSHAVEETGREGKMGPVA